MGTRSRDEWVERFARKDACVAPVLTLQEAPEHPHNRARATFIELGGVTQPAPAPRFSRTATDTPRAPRREGEDGRAILAELGFAAKETAALYEIGVVR